ncbi:MAG: type I secretion system permease/ATPase [Alphaproteobacteria bacterium]
MAAGGSYLLKEMRHHCGTGLLFAAFVGVFIGLLQLTIPLYMLQVYDRVVHSQSMDTLFMLTVLAVGALVFLASLEFIRGRVFTILGERLARRLARPTLQAAVSRSIAEGESTGGQPMRDLYELRQFISTGPVALPIDALFSPLFLGALFLLHPAYGAMGLGSIFVLLGFSVAMEYLGRRPSAAANDATLKSHAEMGTAIRHAEVIEGMGMLSPILRRWQDGQHKAMRQLSAGQGGARAISVSSRATRMMLQVFMLAIGATLVIKQEVMPGSMVAATVIMARLLFPFEQLIDGWRQWGQAIGAYRRLETLTEKAIGVRQSTPVDIHEGRLVVDRLTFRPPGVRKPILNQVSFSLEPGEVLGVVGPSGAGKSTLARLLMGIFAPTAGGAFLDGHGIYAAERESFARAVGYLPQQAVLLDGTIAENIARFQDCPLADVVKAARRVGVHEMIGRLPLGYETRVGESGFSLSGGQRQGIALARAFFGSPRLIVLDEPNTYLDGLAESAMRTAISAAKADGISVVVIAHRPSMMEVADRIMVLRDGVVDQIGPVAEILRALARPAEESQGALAKVTRLPVERAVRL